MIFCSVPLCEIKSYIYFLSFSSFCFYKATGEVANSGEKGAAADKKGTEEKTSGTEDNVSETEYIPSSSSGSS